jgi:2-phosphosulfolactate phosphatase
MPDIQVCFSPALFQYQSAPGTNVIVVDVLRATTSIVEAFKNGVNSMIPVETVEEAKALKAKGYIVAAERDGIVLDFADFGNSPDNFSAQNVKGRDIAYSTTNGTKTIQIASGCNSVAIGAFTNISAVCRWLEQMDGDVCVLCAGWKNKFNLEDSVYAGAVASRLLATGRFSTDCDSAKAAIMLWDTYKDDIIGFVNKSAQKKRLQKNGLDSCIDYCLSHDKTDVLPVFCNGRLIDSKYL